MSARDRTGKRGFALLPVLALIAGGAALGLVLASTARDAAGASENRIAMRRSSWRAEGCLQAALASATRAMATDELTASTAWRSLDSLLRAELSPACAVHAEALGSGLSINIASREQLQSLFRLASLSSADADSLADALVDWRDTDSTPLAAGAERVWYEAHGRAPPRNGPLASVEELALVRGFRDPRIPFDDLVADEGRLFVARASDVAIAAALGLSAAAIAEARRQDGGTPHISTLRGMMPKTASGPPVVDRRVELTEDPDGWRVTSTTASGAPSVPISVEYLLVRSGPRIALLRRREWP